MIRTAQAMRRKPGALRKLILERERLKPSALLKMNARACAAQIALLNGNRAPEFLRA